MSSTGSSSASFRATSVALLPPGCIGKSPKGPSIGICRVNFGGPIWWTQRVGWEWYQMYIKCLTLVSWGAGLDLSWKFGWQEVCLLSKFCQPGNPVKQALFFGIQPRAAPHKRIGPPSHPKRELDRWTGYQETPHGPAMSGIAPELMEDQSNSYVLHDMQSGTPYTNE